MYLKHYLVVFVSITLLFMSFGNLFQLPSSPYPIGSDSNQVSTKVSNMFVVGAQHQINLNFSSNLIDAVLFKTALSTDVDIYINYHFSAGWNVTKTGNAGSSGVSSSMFIPKGSYNISLFLGLALPFNANNPNTLINGSVNYSFSVFDSSNNVLNQSISFPTFNFSFNRSQISNTTNNIEVLSLFYEQFSQSLPVHTSFKFTRSEYNFGANTYNWGIVNGIGTHSIDNGSVRIVFNKSFDGFVLGRMYDPANNSFTPIDVPVGYPFSFMILPANLTIDQFKNIFHSSYGNSLPGFNPVFFNTSDTLAVSMGMNVQSSFQTGVYSLQYLYNRTSGALMYFYYNRTVQYNQYEELHLDGTSIQPLSLPSFLTLDHNQSDANISLNWQSKGQDVNYSILLNGTEISNQDSTSLNYSVTNSGVYSFQLRAINTTSGLISPLSNREIF